jgi:hypothetical protein
LGVSVTQLWVRALPLKQQSILFSGLRGPDTRACPAVKMMSKWLRAVSQQDADPSKPYMQARHLPTTGEVMEELEHLPCHYVHHLADSLAVVAYNHHDEGTRACAYEFHAMIAEELFHFIPEPPDIFEWRHRDKADGVDPMPEKPWEDRIWMVELLPEGYVHP